MIVLVLQLICQQARDEDKLNENLECNIQPLEYYPKEDCNFSRKSLIWNDLFLFGVILDRDAVVELSVG